LSAVAITVPDGLLIRANSRAARAGLEQIARKLRHRNNVRDDQRGPLLCLLRHLRQLLAHLLDHRRG
jgi:hypothetical protein